MITDFEMIADEQIEVLKRGCHKNIALGESQPLLDSHELLTILHELEQSREILRPLGLLTRDAGSSLTILALEPDRSEDVAELCLTPECGTKAHSRGLCANCLGDARSRITSGETTEDELIEAGLMLDRKTPGPKKDRPRKIAAVLLNNRRTRFGPIRYQGASYGDALAKAVEAFSPKHGWGFPLSESSPSTGASNGR